MASHSSVAVIGGGLGGLAAACVTAARGHQVTLYDKNPWLGGKAAVLHEGGFRFDMGPTILTVPRVLERIFAEAGRSVHDYMDLRRLDPQWRCFFDDGTQIDLEETSTAWPPRWTASRRAPVRARLQALPGHLGPSPRRVEPLLLLEARGRPLRHHQHPRQPQSLDAEGRAVPAHGIVGRGHDPQQGEGRASRADARSLRAICGLVPYGAPAVLCAIAHMQAADGVWYPMGGTRAVAEGLMKLASELGVTFKPSSDVGSLKVESGKVTGLTLADGTAAAYDNVISNMDSVRTYRELVGGEVGEHYARKDFEPACSGVVLYLGLKKRYDHLLHHDFVFSRDPHEEFDAIYRRGEPAPDPTCYIAAPSSTDPSVAPEGGEALYVLVHTPYLRPHHDWSQMLPAYRQVILDKLKRTAGMADIEDRIVVERHLTPQDIHDRYKVLNGAIYGLASHGRFMGAFKPGNRSRQVKGLYLAGGPRIPGPGMPMVMMSGWIAADAPRCGRARARAAPAAETSGSRSRLRGLAQGLLAPTFGAPNGAPSSTPWPLPAALKPRRPDGGPRVPDEPALASRAPVHGGLFRPLLPQAHECAAPRAVGRARCAAGGGPVVVYSNHPAWWDAASTSSPPTGCCPITRATPPSMPRCCSATACSAASAPSGSISKPPGAPRLS
jgi:phytoene dehydrogenase-like protein